MSSIGGLVGGGDSGGGAFGDVGDFGGLGDFAGKALDTAGDFFTARENRKGIQANAKARSKRSRRSGGRLKGKARRARRVGTGLTLDGLSDGFVARSSVLGGLGIGSTELLLFGGFALVVVVLIANR